MAHLATLVVHLAAAQFCAAICVGLLAVVWKALR
jgi:hypothetical protein